MPKHPEGAPAPVFARMRVTTGQASATVVGMLAALIGGLVVGALSAQAFNLAFGVALLVLAVGLTAFEPRAVPVLAVPGALLMARVAGDLVSVSDVLLAAATTVTLVVLRPRLNSVIRSMLWAGTAYLALTIPTLILNPYAANFIEWGHEVVLVLGSMVVGFAIGRTDAAPAALWLYVVACAGVGVATIIAASVELAAEGDLTAGVYLPGLHKNFIGGSLATASVIAFARPRWMGGSRRWAVILGLLCLAGVFASQSRQGIAGAVAGIVITLLLTSWHSGWVKLLLPAGLIATTALLIVSVNEQLTSDNMHNSAFVRLNVFEQSYEIWQTSPIFGVGMRWWYTDQFPGAIQPPNAEVEVLTTTGVAGLIGFAILFTGAIVSLLRIDRTFGTIAIAVVVARLVQTQFDLYWVAGQSSMLWIVAGIAVGAWDRSRTRTPVGYASQDLQARGTDDLALGRTLRGSMPASARRENLG